MGNDKVSEVKPIRQEKLKRTKKKSKIELQRQPKPTLSIPIPIPVPIPIPTFHSSEDLKPFSLFDLTLFFFSKMKFVF